MMFVDETKKAIDIIMLKDKNPKAMGVVEALVFYYKASLIPLILTAIVGAIMGTVVGGTLVTFASLFSHSAILGGLLGLLSTGLIVLVIIFVIILFWIIIPIGFLIDAIIYHIFGKLLRQFKQGYNATLSAMVYASMVSVVLFFLLGIPILGFLVGIIVSIWGLVSIIVWLARFQKISWVMSLVVLIVTWIVLFILILLFFGISLGIA